MATFLLILKTILWIILILALVFLALIALLLFFPVSYRVSGKGNGTFRGKVNVHWLFYAVYLAVFFSVGGEKEKPKVVLRIFGIPVKLKRKKKRKKGEPEEEPEEPADASKEPSDKEAAASEKPEEGETAVEIEEASDGEEAGADEKEETKAPGKLDKVKKIFKELGDERNKAAVKHLLAELKKLFSHYKPRKLKMNVLFSTGDPANTGKLTGVLSLLPFVYDHGNKVIPDFEADKAYLSGKISLKGHIILFFALVMVVRLLMDKNIRRLISKVRGGK